MHHIQLLLDAIAAARHTAASLPVSAQRDASLVIKTTLTEALGGTVLRPWRLHSRQGPRLTLLGYSALAPEALCERLTFAVPSARAAVVEVLGYPAPALRGGQRLRFRVRLVPTLHVTGRGERDAFLAAADSAGPGAGLVREQVYAEYLRERLNGAEIEAAGMEGFRIEALARKNASGGFSLKHFPVAELVGALRVESPEELRETLAQGIGRQRAFGFGFVRLEAA